MSETLLRELLEEIRRNVTLLEEFQGVPLEDFVADPHQHLLAERCFQLAIQCVLDACHYIASRKQWQRPEDSAEAILVMGREGVLPPEFARRIVGMANFRTSRDVPGGGPGPGASCRAPTAAAASPTKGDSRLISGSDSATLTGEVAEGGVLPDLDDPPVGEDVSRPRARILWSRTGLIMLTWMC